MEPYRGAHGLKTGQKWFKQLKVDGQVLKIVDVAGAAQLEKFGSKLKGKSFPFSFSHGLKLPYLINVMTSFQTTYMYQFRVIRD